MNQPAPFTATKIGVLRICSWNCLRPRKCHYSPQWKVIGRVVLKGIVSKEKCKTKLEVHMGWGRRLKYLKPKNNIHAMEQHIVNNT